MVSLSQKITVTTDNGTDLSNNVTLIADQYLKLLINLSGGTKDFTNTDTITLTPDSDWMTVVKENKVTIMPQHAVAEFLVKVNSDKQFFNKLQSFTVSTSNTGYYSRRFSFNLSDIMLDTLSLTADKFHIDAPSSENNPDLENTHRVTISTTVKNSAGVAIPNLRVNISANSVDSLSKIGLMDAEGIPLQLNTHDPSLYQQFTLITDADGNLKFYVFPQKNTEVVLAFYSSIEGLSIEKKSKKALFVLYFEGSEFEDHLVAPDIFEIQGGVLKQLDDEKNFNVKIPPYNDARATDYILYLVNDKVLDEYFYVTDLSKLDDYSYQLPYSIFSTSKENKFSYLIARENAYIRYSNSILVKYSGNPNGPPDSDKNRVFDLPKVYSSYGIDPSNIVNPKDTINYNLISQHKFNGGSTLFVEVEADSADNQKVNPGDTVGIKLFIHPTNRGDVSYTGTIQLPKATKGTTSKGHLSIPINITGDIDSGASGRATVIYIEYYKMGGDDDQYSQYWQGYIDTTLPGGGFE